MHSQRFDLRDKSIILSQDEVNLLAKGPKFAVRQALTNENFRIELEKMVSKQNYNDPSLDEANSTKTGIRSSSINGPNFVQESVDKSCFNFKDFSRINIKLSYYYFQKRIV